MEVKKLKVTYQCHNCGFQQDKIEENHADAAQKILPHNKPGDVGIVTPCDGQSHPIHLEEVA